MKGPPPLDLAHFAQAVRWWMWIGMALLLVIARFLPIALPRRTIGAVVCGSIVVAAVGLHLLVGSIRANPGLERTESFDTLIAEVARNYRPERPTLLIVGSSRSALGLDGVALERKLQTTLRRDVQVLQFSSAGHFALEQLYTTRRLIERMRPRRLTVLVELGTEITLGVPDAMTYTSRGIDFFDARVFMINWRLWRAARAGNADHPTYSYRQLLRTLAHTALRHLGVGLLFDLEPPAPPGREPGFAPKTEPPTPGNMQATRDVLPRSTAAIQVPSDQAELIAIVRNELAEDLAALVPELELVFFYPPSVELAMRAEAPLGCAAVAHLGPCLHMTDDDLRTLLPAGNWFDLGHLNASGAGIFTEWLAARLGEKLAPLPPQTLPLIYFQF